MPVCLRQRNGEVLFSNWDFEKVKENGTFAEWTFKKWKRMTLLIFWFLHSWYSHENMQFFILHSSYSHEKMQFLFLLVWEPGRWTYIVFLCLFGARSRYSFVVFVAVARSILTFLISVFIFARSRYSLFFLCVVLVFVWFCSIRTGLQTQKRKKMEPGRAPSCFLGGWSQVVCDRF